MNGISGLGWNFFKGICSIKVIIFFSRKCWYGNVVGFVFVCWGFNVDSK